MWKNIFSKLKGKEWNLEKVIDRGYETKTYYAFEVFNKEGVAIETFTSYSLKELSKKITRYINESK